MKFLKKLAFLFYLIVLFPFLASAASPSSISVNIAPENPAPNENTEIILSSYSYNLDSVLISWSVDGKAVSSGIGKKSFSATAPEAGKQTTISASISLPDGTIQKTIILRPAVMLLLWQGTDSYVPPFYRGKAMPGPGSEIKVVGMPEIKSGSQTVNPRNMVYTWKEDYTNMPAASGYGKNFFTYVNDYLDDINNINVVASTVDQRYFSERSIDIGTTEPKILFYKDDSNLGTLWEKTISNGHQIPGSEIIRAMPYFISPKDIRIPSLVFAWYINNFRVDVPIYNKNVLPVQAGAGVSGSSSIRLEISNMDKIFESATKQINVQF